MCAAEVGVDDKPGSRAAHGLTLRGSHCVVIKLRDDVQVAVPTWMLDPVCCQQLTDEAQPRSAISALRALRALIDSQSWLVTTRQAATPPRGSSSHRR